MTYFDTNEFLFVTMPYDMGGGSFDNGQIFVLNGTTHLVIQTMFTSLNPRFLVPSFSGAEIAFYAICAGDQDSVFGKVDFFTDTGPKTGTADIGGNPEFFAVDSGKLFIGDASAPNIYLIALGTDDVVRDGGNPIVLPSGGAVTAMAAEPTSATIFVGNDEGTVFALDSDTETFGDDFDFGSYDIVSIRTW
ncbi:MAG: hypothetical protein M5R36_20590 [Deltaproteobacteria bacterium]|nr:hypothetical protein [Deltaproteobacteria bacterium]